MNDMTGEVTVRDNTEKHRFEVYEGEERAGHSVYKDLGDQRIFFHTKVFDVFGGKGLASVLTREALAQSIAAGKRIVPVCPYVVKWIEGHHDFDDAVDQATQEHLDAVNAG